MKPFFSVLLILLISITTSCKVQEKTDYEYLNSWPVRAITLQNRLSLNVPMRLAEFPATHNSFNAQAYSNGVSYTDPNHIPSMLNQLRMGKRMINMDLHWDIHFNSKKRLIETDIVLCHDSSDFGICSMWDRTFDEGLQEIYEWLRDNDEVVILKLQDELDGHYAEAYESIHRIIGELVYTPDGACETFNLETSKADILASGKKLIITGAKPNNCNLAWGEYVHWDEGMFARVNHEKFEPYPVCNNAIDEISRKIYGATNDGTQVAQIILQTKEMTSEQVVDLSRCGVTAISFEPLRWWDERHTAQIWSWDIDRPTDNNNLENCALQQMNGRFIDAVCSEKYAFACQEPNNRKWRITQMQGYWSQGEETCDNEFGHLGYEFSVPANGYENSQLNELLNIAELTAIWLRYSDREQEGYWETR